LVEQKTYFPALTIREAEIKALNKLAGPTKDRLFPIVRLQAWPRSKKDGPPLIERSLHKYIEAMEERSAALDLAVPRTDRDSDAAIQGRAEISKLRDPRCGFQVWVELIKRYPQFVPTVVWCDDADNLKVEIKSLIEIGRGIVLRLRRSQRWNLPNLSIVDSAVLKGQKILVVMDCEQIDRREDILLVATEVQTVALRISSILNSENVQFVVVGSSFPSDFASIHNRTAKLDIRERQIFSLLDGSPALVKAHMKLRYGDHASVFAGEREPQFRGLPRVDYPAPLKWIYHRRPQSEGFVAAAKAIVAEPEWNEALLCWGAQEIRRAADGDASGLGAAAPWTAVRINLHLHRQAHFDDHETGPIEEEWKD
jgi:hypothetical protein